MFWDTVDLFTDEKETLEKKKHRRRSNHYERKVDKLDNIIDDINAKLKSLETYNLGKYILIGDEEDVYARGYKEYKDKIYKDMDTLETDFEAAKTKLKTARDQIYQRHQEHYKKGV
ncbi:MAG: hypothetical protein ACK5LC_02900 [Coprobacillaceae bacterium]